MTVPITFVLTSCGRFDLLERTLESFAATNDYPIRRYIIIEDSEDERVLRMRDRFPELNLEIVINRPRLGQLASIDKAYAMVNTEYIFHCEDDWLFTKPGVITRSLVLLQAFPDVVMVWPRGSGSHGPDWIMRLPMIEEKGVRYRPIDPKAHHRWGNFTFNPGLRRLSDYHRLPSYAEVGGEGAVSVAYKRLGLRMVLLEDGGVDHIGSGRSTLEAPTRNPIARLRQSIAKRASHVLWRLKRAWQ
jgi:hypothetical protein